MYFRFATAIALLTAISLVGIAMDKQVLALKRSISLQHYQLQILREQEARLRLDVQRLESPMRLRELSRSPQQPVGRIRR